MFKKPVCSKCEYLSFFFFFCKCPYLTNSNKKYSWFKEHKGPTHPYAFMVNQYNNCMYFKETRSIFKKIRNILSTPTSTLGPR